LRSPSKRAVAIDRHQHAHDLDIETGRHGKGPI
jgi:hypothetical protein